jgi:glycosyltransferase involved in cell wall biosynthesis
MCNNPNTHTNCEKCLGGKFLNCTKGKCIHGSTLKSFIGTCEATFWKLNGAYKKIDKIICCSEFLKTKMDTNPVFACKTVALHNFIRRTDYPVQPKKDYVLYFGRFSQEKGIKTLIDVCRQLPHVNFVFAGTGPLEDELSEVSNIKNLGFMTGDDLRTLIAESLFTVYPSEWYENCPFSVMESQLFGTPVLGADIGGIPELIQDGVTGELFESGNAEMLRQKIEKLWNNRELTALYSSNCKYLDFDTVEEYVEKVKGVLTL